jgi:hypothetical protein
MSNNIKESEKKSYLRDLLSLSNNSHGIKNGEERERKEPAIPKQIELVAESEKDLEGCLLVVKLGSPENPASSEEISEFKESLHDVFKNVRGIKVLVVPHNFSIEKISLPQLRNLESEVLKSTEQIENENIIIKGLEV